MSGKPEPRAGASGLHNVVVYVSGDGFGYPQQNNSHGTVYQAPTPVKPPKIPSQGFYNVQQQQNGYQGNSNVNYSSGNSGGVVNHVYNGPAVRNVNAVGGTSSAGGFAITGARREDGNASGGFLAVMGGEGGVVFPRCDSARSEIAESSCSSLSSSGGDSQSDGVGGYRTETSISAASVSVSVSAAVQQPFNKTVYQVASATDNNTTSVAVPLGWKRLHTNGMVIYISPSNTALSSLEQVKAYLQTQGTCKCGLECPLKCDIVFNFDPKVATRPWSTASAPPGDLTKLCNHKRKLLAMNSIDQHHLDMKKFDAGIKRKKRKLGVMYTGAGSASVSQLLAQRDKERSKEAALHPQQGWVDGSTQIGRDGSPMMMQQNQMAGMPPVINRAIYPPNYVDSNTVNQSNHPPPPPGTQFFRYNPHNANFNNCHTTGQQVQPVPPPPPPPPSQVIENGQVDNLVFSTTGSTYIHPSVVMASNGQCNNNQNNSVVMQQGVMCGPGNRHMNNTMVLNHQQQQAMGFVQQPSRLHMGCATDGSDMQHAHCNTIGNKQQIVNQQQIIMQQQQQQHQQQQHQHQQQQSIINQQSHFQTPPSQPHQITHQVPPHLINSSSPRPQSHHTAGSVTGIQQSHNMVPSSHHSYDTNHVGPQFHSQQQFAHQQENVNSNTGKTIQLSQQHIHVVDNKLGNNNNANNKQIITNTHMAGNVREMYPGVPNNRNDIPVTLQQVQQGSAMVLQTSQGQVMIPHGQTMVLHNQQNSSMMPQTQVSQSSNIGQQQLQTLNIQGSTMVVQGSPSILPQGHNVGTQGQMVLHGQQSSQIVPSGLQVQTIGTQQGTAVVLQGQHPQSMQNSHLQNPNNSGGQMCTSPAGMVIHQRPTPPWQQNRNNQMAQQQQHQQQIQTTQPNPYDRVPPLHHHTAPTPVWNDDMVRKKNKPVTKTVTHIVKKQRSPYSVDHHSVGTSSDTPCPNVDVRHLPQDQNRPLSSQNYTNANNIPSFMEDPSGYLAQQTALLNSTISRQTGVNPNGLNIVCHSPCNSNTNNGSTSSTTQNVGEHNTGQLVINLPTSSCSPLGNQGVPVPSSILVSTGNAKVGNSQQSFQVRNNPPLGLKVYRSNSVSSSGNNIYQNQQQTTVVADSSGVSPDRGRCPPGCSNSSFDTIQSQHQVNQHLSHSSVNTVKQSQSEESPVTSSTFMENRGGQNQAVAPIVTQDNKGPIQGGTVSTSNRSPVETVTRIPPDAPSPGGQATPTSTQNQHSDASPESTNNIFISSSSPYTISSNHFTFSQQNQNISSRSHEHLTLSVSQSPKSQQPQHHNINVLLQDIATSRTPAIVTTMASGHTVSSNTITSVLAGRANTATVTVNNTATVGSQTIPPPVLTNQPVSVSKSPLEMVQSVVSSIQVPVSSAPDTILKPASGPGLPAGHILVSSNGQLIVANTPGGPPTILSPQQNITKIANSPMPPMSGVSTIVTSVTGAVTQVIPAVGVTQQVLGQPTVLVNTLPAPLLFQPGVMTVDGTTMNTVQIPHLAVATGNVLQPGQVVEDSRVNNNSNSSGAFSPRNQPALLSPEGSNGKRKTNVKKRKVSPQTVASMLHIAAQQNSPTAGATGMVVQQQQPQQNFGSAAPMLQALTILPSKTGHFGGTQQLIATANVLQPLNLVQNFPTIQQFIVPAGLGGMVMATGDGTATLLQDTVHLNVLTPVQGPTGTVFGHTSGQSILAAGPAGMVIRAPANNTQQAGKMQLHPQNTVQTGGGGQFIASSPNQFLMNSPATFGGQLSPMLANVSPTNQQIHSFNTSAANTQGRPGQPHQEFIQCGQTLMVPCSPAQNSQSQNTTVVQQNTTIVQQQTTMVSNNQQNIEQNPGPSTSSSSSLSLNQHNFILNNPNDGKQQNFIITADKQGQGNFILSPNPDKHQGTHIILNNLNTTEKQSQSCGGFIISQEKPGQVCGNFILSNSNLHSSEKSTGNFIISSGNITEKQTVSRFAKHSVSTQTAANQQVLQVSPTPLALVVATSNTFSQTSTAPSSYSGSPPDTTTHSPVDGGPSHSPGLNAEAPTSSVAIGSTDDNLSSPTSSSDPPGRPQPMVHCVSSSNEQDTPEWTGKESTSSSPAVFSPPPANIEIGFNRGGGGTGMKTISMNSYVESSSTTLQSYESERLHKRTSDQELLVRHTYDYGSHARNAKRKHPACTENEARIQTSTVTTLSPQDDDDEDSDASSVSEGSGGPGPGAGDLVWGAARGFPSWPGKLVGPAPTSGRVWVRWFGGAGNLTEVDPSHLKTLSEGLEAHHRARKKFRKSRKLNSQLENAIQEAMAELDRMSETPQQGAPLPPTQSVAVLDNRARRSQR